MQDFINVYFCGALDPKSSAVFTKFLLNLLYSLFANFNALIIFASLSVMGTMQDSLGPECCKNFVPYLLVKPGSLKLFTPGFVPWEPRTLSTMIVHDHLLHLM